MLNKQQMAKLEPIFDQHGLSERTRKLVRRICTTEPTRTVRSGRRNVPTRFPSRKMGLVIQAESHRNELATLYAPTNREAQTILTEASDGERKLVDIPFSMLQSQSGAQFKQLKEMNVEVEELGQRLGRASQKPKVGERRAKRDPVGKTYEAEQAEFELV